MAQARMLVAVIGLWAGAALLRGALPMTEPADLSRTTYKDLAVLKDRAAAAGDEQLRGTLLARIAAIEEEMAIDPPPISLDVTGATLPQVIANLNGAMGTNIELAQVAWRKTVKPGIPASTFTLQAKELPFWDVFLKLNKQNGLELNYGGSLVGGLSGPQITGYSQLFLGEADEGLQTAARVRGFALFPLKLERKEEVTLHGAGGAGVRKDTLLLQAQLAWDPRIAVVKRVCIWTDVVDDRGQVLLKKPEWQGALSSWFSGYNNGDSVGTWLELPKVPGARIASAKMVGRFSIQLSEATLEVAEPEKTLNQKLNVGGHEVVIEKLELKKEDIAGRGGIDLRVNVLSDLPAEEAARTPLAGPNDPVTVTLIDGDGKVIWQEMVTGKLSWRIQDRFGGSRFKAPLHIRLAAPTKQKEITVRFELKDLPLP